jgi:hypothetical protein
MYESAWARSRIIGRKKRQMLRDERWYQALCIFVVMLGLYLTGSMMYQINNSIEEKYERDRKAREHYIKVCTPLCIPHRYIYHSIEEGCICDMTKRNIPLKEDRLYEP